MDGDIMSSLKERIERLRETISGGRDSNETYMSKMRNWCCVHTTRYEPKKNNDGDLYIETTAMATNNELPRASIHVTLNQVVASHLGGNWDDAPIVVLAPYNDVVEKNGNPQEVATADTYFIPNPDTGLVLPSSVYIVKPSKEGDALFEIGENGATYKTDNYTAEEIEEILSLSEFDRYQYDEYMKGDVPEYNVKRILGYDENLIKVYEGTEDKQAFMRGIFEEDRFVILNKLLRNAVVKMAMEKMDFRYVLSHEDEVTGVVAEVARDEGIRGDSGNKGHSCSLECELEQEGCALVAVSRKLREGNVDEAVNALGGCSGVVSDKFISCVLNDAPFTDFHDMYKKSFDDYMRRKVAFVGKGDDEPKTIEEYNPNLDVVLKRHSIQMARELNLSMNELKKDPEKYEDLKMCLRERQEMQRQANSIKMGRDSDFGNW